MIHLICHYLTIRAITLSKKLGSNCLERSWGRRSDWRVVWSARTAQGVDDVFIAPLRRWCLLRKIASATSWISLTAKFSFADVFRIINVNQLFEPTWRRKGRIRLCFLGWANDANALNTWNEKWMKGLSSLFERSSKVTRVDLIRITGIWRVFGIQLIRLLENSLVKFGLTLSAVTSKTQVGSLEWDWIAHLHIGTSRLTNVERARENGRTNSSSVQVRNYNGAIHHERPAIRHAPIHACESRRFWICAALYSNASTCIHVYLRAVLQDDTPRIKDFHGRPWRTLNQAL